MNRIFAFFILGALLIGEENINSKSSITPNIVDSNLDSIQISEENIENIMNPARAISSSFVAFSVGYHFLHNAYYKTRENKNGIFFSIEKGWALIDNILLLSIIIDGSAGDFYSINGGSRIGARILDGRIIPSFGLEFGVINRDIDNKQYNAIGNTGSFSIFVDIASGFGIELEYKLALHPFIIIDNNLKNNKIDNIHNFIFNLRFMYF